MARIKIISNPYKREILYFNFNEESAEWEDIKNNNANSRLREDESGKAFLPFKIKEIVDIIVEEYYAGADKIEIEFEGTRDDYAEVEAVCQTDDIREKVILTRNVRTLENARDILEDIKDTFEVVHPIIKKIVHDDERVKKDLNKVSDALDDIIPICVFGNYSAGKSTFINALLGSEILPSGGDPVTAKIYQIERSMQEDRAKIRFTYKEENILLLFEGTTYRVQAENVESEIIQEIDKAIAECKYNDMSSMVSCALELINGFKKRDKNKIVIGNVIELEIPFSRNGILGQSYNKFVIFDTPGSNSASNSEHSKVLAEALEGFSNGIPVWITQYETIDSEDNANLCDKIFEIKALDKRFTMIVLNKADGSDLPEEGLSEGQVKDILEYNAVEKMYAGGLYFVSSIMGLGAKNNGELKDKHYRKTYRSQQEMYSDPDDLDYVVLYKFNIMPEQIKHAAVECSAKCGNLIYANSGLYCIEREIENFASKHSAYNKCQMVYMFLNDVIDETNKRITYRAESLKKTREARKKELESTKSQLIESIMEEAQTKESEFDRESKTFLKSFLDKKLIYAYTTEDLDGLGAQIRSQNSDESDFLLQEKDFEKAKDSMWGHLKANGRGLLKGNIISSIKNMKEDFAKDYKELQESKKEMDFAESEIDKATSDSLLQIVIDEYKKNILAAKDILSEEIKGRWYANAQLLRNGLIEIITGSEALSVGQREELSSIIINYRPLEFNDDADNIFIKKRFLRGNVLGFQWFESEKLDTKRLSGSYNEKMRKNIRAIAEEMNNGCFVSFKNWEQSLASVIETNITEYNPQLRDMAEMIKEETDKIIELEENQKAISSSLETIREMMAWKILE
ncbi:dynamin family protein [Acetatifactor aquisgranensis]|uniref:dynamin family protein n=1 Tax=Acetatifactor aquisgranensis TaxID=2941233 RepID=UPI00203EE68C|nr:dynamin family protein [Acetatifactor aquisgranensis]